LEFFLFFRGLPVEADVDVVIGGDIIEAAIITTIILIVGMCFLEVFGVEEELSIITIIMVEDIEEADLLEVVDQVGENNLWNV
jgi:hypothetical protein